MADSHGTFMDEYVFPDAVSTQFFSKALILRWSNVACSSASKYDSSKAAP
jgi:hypothetical protein